MSKRMGRPPVPAEDRKSAKMVFMATERTRQELEDQARNRGVTVATVIRAALVEHLESTED